MVKKTRVEDIDSDAIINSFRQDDTSIPPGARSTEGVTVPPPRTAACPEHSGTGSRPRAIRSGCRGGTHGRRV